MSFIIHRTAQKIAASLLLTAALSSYALASNAPVKDVTEKAKKAFVKTFPSAEATNWTESKSGDTYTAYSRMYDVKTVSPISTATCQLYQRVRKYYGEDRLPLTVRCPF